MWELGQCALHNVKSPRAAHNTFKAQILDEFPQIEILEDKTGVKVLQQARTT